MGGAGMGRRGPMVERLVALVRVGDRLAEPGVEDLRGARVARVEALHVVPTHAAAKDQHTLIP